jgi:hypothetical protein
MKRLIISFTATALLISACCTAQQVSKQDRSVIISKAIGLMEENYIYPERVADIRQQLQQQMKKGAYDSLHQAKDFLQVLNNDMERFGHDHHLNISYGPERVKQILADEKNEKEGREETITEGFLQQIRYENFRMRKLERLDGNIGYFSFLNFTPLPVSKQSLAAAMNFLYYSNAIIIDLRDNGGGYAATMNFLLSYFLEDSVPVSMHRFRKNNTVVKTFTIQDELIRKIPANTPLYILVSNRTSSAAEGFAYTLQQYKRAVILGEPTKGEGNPGSLFAINNSLYMMIPTAEAINAISGNSIEFTGVVPDIKTGRPKAMTMALLQAYRLLATSTSIKESKTLYEWQIPFFENELDPAALTAGIIENISGRYEGGRKILFENDALIYVNSKGERDKLIYIGKGIFQSSNYKWQRLVMPYTDKTVPYVEWIWDDGGEPQRLKRE